jgi:hypothetical protein
MSRTIDIQIHMGSQTPDAFWVFSRILDAVTSWGEVVGPWRNFKVERSLSQDPIAEIDSASSIEDLKVVGSQYAAISGRCFDTDVMFRCWGIGDEAPVPGASDLSVRAWDRDAFRVGDPARWILGDAELAIDKFWPFFADVRPEAKNEAVAENLDALGRLVECLVEHLKPDSVKVFVDYNWKLPFNAHLLYYRNSRLVIEDLQMMGEVWKSGIDECRLPSLETYPDGNDFTFSELLPLNEREEIWREIASVVPFSNDVSEEDVEAALCTCGFEWNEMGEGFVIFSVPHMFNTQLHRFYVDTLRNCKNRLT